MILFLHPADVLFGLAITVLLCVALVALFGVLVARYRKGIHRRSRHVGGINRGQRRMERAMHRQKSKHH